MSAVQCFFLIQFQLHVVDVFSPMKTSCGGQKQMMPPRCKMFKLPPAQDENTKPLFQM
jgi:hypothetical protein